MAERLQLPIPMWRVQFQLLGGHRRLATVLVISATVIVAGTFGMQRLLPKEPLPNIVRWILNILMGLQAAMLTLGGANAIYRTMLRDYQTKMIESHRLAPISNVGVVLGYLFGGTLQILALFALFLLSGIGLCFLGGVSVGTSIESWIYGNLLLLSGAVTIWAASVFVGMRVEKPISTAPMVVGIAALTVPLAFVPVAGLLLSMYSVLLAIWLITGLVAVSTPACVIVAIANTVLTVFWISTAAVKYRRPDLPAFNGGRGLVLLLLTLIAGVGGLIAFERIASGTQVGLPSDVLSVQWVATMLGSLFVALVAISGAVKCRVLGEEGTALRSWRDRISPDVVAVVAVAMIIGVMGKAGKPLWEELTFEGFWQPAWTGSAVACLVAAFTMRSVFGVCYRLMKSPRFLIGMFLLVAWGLPPIVDAMRGEMMRDFDKPTQYSMIFGCSPVGTILACWGEVPGVAIWSGIMVQGLLLGVLTIAEWRVRRRRKKGGDSVAEIELTG